MRLKILSLAILSIFAVTYACGDNDDDNTPQKPSDPAVAGIPQVCQDAFAQRYPKAQRVKWEIKKPYYVADFADVNGTVDTEAWFKADGTWAMSEADYGKDLFMIPTAVNLAFEKTEYRTWTISDISHYTYPDQTKEFYVIEVEKTGSADTDLYFRADGTLFKTAPDTGTDITPDTAV